MLRTGCEERYGPAGAEIPPLSRGACRNLTDGALVNRRIGRLNVFQKLRERVQGWGRVGVD